MSIGVVVITRNRRQRLLETLAQLRRLPGHPPVVLVDNGSSDGTCRAVYERHPWVRVLALGTNEGAAARNRGVRHLDTDLVAFCDDDSWWEPSALPIAERLFEAHPRLALIAGRVLVEPEGRIDPVSGAMAASALRPLAGLPGPRVLGFLACAAIVRRQAFLEVGGFHPRLGVGGEEELLALDLRANGWELVYAEGVVAHHHPERRPPGFRRRTELRNRLWVIWLRRPPASAVRRTLTLVVASRPADAAAALASGSRDWRWIARERRRLPADVEQEVRLLERPFAGRGPRPGWLRRPRPGKRPETTR